MEDELPGSAHLSHLKEIEERISSPNRETKLDAVGQLQELLRTKERVVIKSKKIETAVDLLDNAKIDPDKMLKLKSVAESVDALFTKAEKKDLSSDEINIVNKELRELAVQLGIKESTEGLEVIINKIGWLEAAQEARQFVTEKGLYLSPIQEYATEFNEKKEGEVLRLRDVSNRDKERLRARLDLFKRTVSRELVVGDHKKIEKLTTEELLGRLKETTYWQANLKHLQGKRKWVGNKNVVELRDILGRVEAQYQAILEEKLMVKITKDHASQNISKEHVRLAIVEELHTKRRFMRTEYDFSKDLKRGKSQAQNFEDGVVARTRRIHNNGETRIGRSTTQNEEPTGEGEPYPRGQGISIEESEKYEEDARNREDVVALFNKIGVSYEDLINNRHNPDMRAKWFKKAERAGVSAVELRTIKKALDSFESEAGTGRMGRELSEKQKELEVLKKSGAHNKFLIKLKAYVERVGLREVSSDWDFAIMMRQAKEEISRVNPDAGEKLDQWQEALFAPALITLDEKTFHDIMPKMMTQGRLEHELSDKYANWEAMQIIGSDGTKKVVSVASFYQLLQREDVAKRILDADTNANDSTIQQILVEHIWGEGAKLNTEFRLNTNQPKPPKMWITFENSRKRIEEIKVSYFSMDGKNNVDPKQSELLELHDFIDQAMWMTHYAKTLWHYSGEWEPFLRDFPGDQLSQANKRLIAIGSAFRDYGLDYGKFDVGYESLAKAGVLLQDFRTYKAQDVLKVNIRHMLYDKKDNNGEPIASHKRGDEIGEALWRAVQKRAFIDEAYNPVVGMRSIEEMRLMGDLPKNEKEGWEWFKNKQEKVGRKGVLDFAAIVRLREKSSRGTLTSVEEAWLVQASEVEKWIKDLTEQRAKLDSLGLTRAELAPLMRKQAILTSGEYVAGKEDLDGFLRNFEYSSIIDHAELRKGTDPTDYKNYSNAKMEAAKLMTDVLSGSPTLENINQLYNTMKGYMPPEQLMAWFEAYTKRRVLLRTTQLVKYEIAMTDLEWWNLKKARGEISVDEKAPPEAVLGINPAVYKIKDDRGDSWNVVGADGFKVTKKKMEWGNHMKKTRDIPGLTAKDIETEMRLYVGNRWLPSKEVGERILEGSLGLGQMIDHYYKNRGWDANKSNFAKFIKHYGSKAVMLLRQHPLFDDPVWAFWSIINEYWEFTREAGKEVGKQAIGGR